MVLKLKVLLVDQLLDGCGDEILQVGYCMSLGGIGRGRDRMGEWFLSVHVHVFYMDKLSECTYTSRVVINTFE